MWTIADSGVQDCHWLHSPWIHEGGALNPLADWKSKKALLLPQAPLNQVIEKWGLTLGVIEERALSKCSNLSMCLMCPLTYREVFLNWSLSWLTSAWSECQLQTDVPAVVWAKHMLVVWNEEDTYLLLWKSNAEML